MKVIIAKNYKELSKQAAKIFLDKLVAKKKVVFGLASGSTPLGMYRELVSQSKKNNYDWSGVKTFNLDEYCGLGPEHKQSYAYFMQTKLFKYLNIKKENIHMPDGLAKETVKFCKEYEKLLDKEGVDIQLLGLGQNGHIAFNEPGSRKDSKTRLVNLNQETLKANARFFKNKNEVPRRAITMGIGSILKARQIVLLASGAAKAEAVRNMLEDRISPQCPASFLREHKNTLIIIDRAAAVLLKKANNFTGNVL